MQGAMNETGAADAKTASEPEARRTASLLVRAWQEREAEGGPVRYFVRNLRTGEERHVGDAADLVRYLELQVPREAAAERPPRAAGGSGMMDAPAGASPAFGASC